MRNRPYLIDANIILRFLVEDPQRVAEKFKGVFGFFSRIESGEVQVELVDLVLFEVYFVLTRLYKIPRIDAAKNLLKLVSLAGISMRDKPVARGCLKILQNASVDLVDAYLMASARKRGQRAIYSYDADLARLGLTLLPVL